MSGILLRLVTLRYLAVFTKMLVFALFVRKSRVL